MAKPAIYLGYDPEKDTPIFDKEGNPLLFIPKDKKIHIFNKDGMRLSKRTLLLPQKRGFGTKEGRKKINKGGRPKSSSAKVKVGVLHAVSALESHTLEAAQLIVDIMRGDEKKVGAEIKLSDRQAAARLVIEQPHKMRKNLRETLEGIEEDKLNKHKSKERILEDEELNNQQHKEEDKVIPLISLTVAE